MKWFGRNGYAMIYKNDVIPYHGVLRHLPTLAHYKYARPLKLGGVLILTAPFGSNVHMAPYHYCSGFSKDWYEYHLVQRGLRIETLIANGDWYALLLQEITRLGSQERQHNNYTWQIAYAYSLLGVLYFKLRSKKQAEDLACFGWQCVAVKNESSNGS